jgi:peptidoglycan LD-endopeptidase LytH
MRKLCLILLVAVTVLLLLVNWTSVSGATENLASKFVFYMHVARLYAREPDQKLEMPLELVHKEDISNTWHALRSGDRLHEGQDLFAPRGTPILSATEGYVYHIGENPLGGQTVSVIGAGGRVYYYAHLDSYAPAISVGDHVTPRSILGYVGTTGNAAGTPPHLHFGVYTATGAINPLPLLVNRPVPQRVSNKETQQAASKSSKRKAAN